MLNVIEHSNKPATCATQGRTLNGLQSTCPADLSRRSFSEGGSLGEGGGLGARGWGLGAGENGENLLSAWRAEAVRGAGRGEAGTGHASAADDEIRVCVDVAAIHVDDTRLLDERFSGN